MLAKFLLIFAATMTSAPPILSGSLSYVQEGDHAELTKFERVEFERTECYGWCPIYKVTIKGNGDVGYEGRQYVKQKGAASRRLSRTQLTRLLGELNAVDFFSLRDEYTSEADGCTSIATDNPSAIITVVAGGREKAIRHYYGCRARFGDLEPHPAFLVKLARAIDEIVGIEEWIGTPKERQQMYLRGEL